jgi:hypothetical protein
MSDMTIKTILATAFLAAGAAAFLAMMTLMGRPGTAGDPAKLKRRHKIFGWLYVALLVPLVYLGADFIGEMGDGMSTRAVLHLVLAETLVALLFLKLLVVRVFRGLLKSATALGMTLFALTLVIYLVTAGFYLIQTVAAE